MSSRRRLGILGGLGIFGAVVAAGVFWALHTPVFSVTRIETGSYRFTAPAALDSVLGTFLGRNILALNGDEVADSMADLAWVRDLHIQRRMPGTLAVDFREWRPLAVIAREESTPGSGGPTLVLGENGRVLEFPTQLEVPALPTLVGYGPSGKSLSPGAESSARDSTDADETAQLLALFQAIADTGLEMVAAVDFVVVRSEGYVIVLAGSQGRLQVGREDFRPRLERYLASRPHLEPGLEVDLRFADRVTVHRH